MRLSTSLYQLLIGIIIGGAIAFPVGVITDKAFYSRKRDVNQSARSPLLIEGFDFSLLRAPDNEWRGPNIGERIDLNRLKTKDEKTLASTVGQRPIMLVSVNPNCAMCKIASDEMTDLRKELSSLDIDYCIVSFSSSTPQSDFFSYADSLKVGGQSFLWNSEVGLPPESIFKMTNPSHLLVDRHGTVIRVWPGSYKDKPVRQRMAQQILADTRVVIDTLSVRLPQDLRNPQANLFRH